MKYETMLQVFKNSPEIVTELHDKYQALDQKGELRGCHTYNTGRRIIVKAIETKEYGFIEKYLSALLNEIKLENFYCGKNDLETPKVYKLLARFCKANDRVFHPTNESLERDLKRCDADMIEINKVDYVKIVELIIKNIFITYIDDELKAKLDGINKKLDLVRLNKI